MPESETLYVRQSALKKFKRCRRSWWLLYHRELTLPPSPTPEKGQRQLGTLVHKCLENWNTGEDPYAPIAEFERDLAETAAVFGETDIHPDHVKNLSLARLMVEGYIEWEETDGARPHEEVVAVEKQIELPLGRFGDHDVVLTGRIDRVLLDTFSGDHIVDDYKTVANFDKGQEFWIDDQLLTYAWMLRETDGLTVRTGRHTMLRKVGRSARAKPPFYAREDVYINDAMIEAAAAHTHDIVRDMVTALENESLYPNPTRDCSWDCDALPVCSMFDDGSDAEAMIQQVYVRRESK